RKSLDVSRHPARSGSRDHRVNVGLLGMYGSANLGDTAIQSVVMTSLRSRRPDIQFVGICTDPEDVVKTHAIPSFPISGEGSLVTACTDSGRGRSEIAGMAVELP